MNIVFNPTQLEVSRHAETLRHLVQEMAPAGCTGELRVLHPYHDEPLRMVLIRAGQWPVSITMPLAALYDEKAEYELRERLAELFHAAAKPVLAD